MATVARLFMYVCSRRCRQVWLAFPHTHLPAWQVEEVETALSSMPTVTVTAACEVDGEPEAQVQAEDVVTCKARVLLSRPSHATHGTSSQFYRVTSEIVAQKPWRHWWIFCASSCKQCAARTIERPSCVCHSEICALRARVCSTTC